MLTSYYYQRFNALAPQIKVLPKNDLGLVVVIPCYNEPKLISAIESLWNCERPLCSVEVIVVVNSALNAEESVLATNKSTISDLNNWINKHTDDRFNVYCIDMPSLPVKHAGVGLARKIGMDEAARRFDAINNKQGVMICFDADCVCDKNYLLEIFKVFYENKNTNGCSIYFEHPIDGNEYSSDVYEGIIHYELFLRYYKLALQWAGFPYAFHTIGSSMAVRSNVYKKQGGMNRRKAGEDFYFLHKIIPLGDFAEINTTRVIASPRPSNRVPFGTGRAVQKWLDSDKKEYKTYAFKIFEDLKILIDQIPNLYEKDLIVLPDPINIFLKNSHFVKKLTEIKANCTSRQLFIKRFYNWFDGFMILKYIHFARDNYYNEGTIENECNLLLDKLGIKPINSKIELLEKYRELDRNGSFN